MEILKLFTRDKVMIYISDHVFSHEVPLFWKATYKLHNKSHSDMGRQHSELHFLRNAFNTLIAAVFRFLQKKKQNKQTKKKTKT